MSDPPIEPRVPRTESGPKEADTTVAASNFDGGWTPPAETIAGVPQIAAFIGRYRLIHKLGKGGFGIVWQAEQTEPIRREVALKIIKPGMNSAEIVARFESERQTLAMMAHPNIAAVFDAGTTKEGRPYFAMELVRGVAITDYCDERRLTIRERVGLFISICNAVQHAHQRAILHRDLKPSNILVTEVDGVAVPKVIDFGISKALDSASQAMLQGNLMETKEGAFIGTPQYMSPEQAGACRNLDARSDIYTLGVILYELLIGNTPVPCEALQSVMVSEVLQLVREADASRPSSRLMPVTPEVAERAAARHTEPAKLVRALRDDLDWIVLKALEKDREHRYESAAALADDLERHLRNQPVYARRSSASYRVEKFVRRNKGRLLASTLAVLVVAGIAGTTLGMIRASQHANAEAALQKLVDEANALAKSYEAKVVELELLRASGPVASAAPAAEEQKLVNETTALAKSLEEKVKEIEQSPRPAPSKPYQSDADLEKYARTLRESSLLRLEPRVLIPATASPLSASEKFPWKRNIVTTVFWVGEPGTGKKSGRKTRSAWDAAWAQTFGGYDPPDPNARVLDSKENDFRPAKFVPKLNPFYFALPYNDVSDGHHEPEASKIIPWFREAFLEDGKTVLQDRWICIRTRFGKECYAQWADCGPFITDHWQYVFGTDRPKPNANKGAGLDVSPAVRDFLGIDSTDVTDWRFVEWREVPRGPWRRYGENNQWVQWERASNRTAPLSPTPKSTPANSGTSKSVGPKGDKR